MDESRRLRAKEGVEEEAGKKIAKPAAEAEVETEMETTRSAEQGRTC